MPGKRDTCQFVVNTGGEICGVDLSGHRPYANKRDGVPSVSAIAGLLDGGKSSSFGWVASTIAARYAVHSDDLSRFSTEECDHDAKRYCERCAFIRSRFDAEWAAKADLGTHVHHMALSWASGEAVTDDETSAPYIDGLEAFYAEHAPAWLHLERTVECDEIGYEYRGQFDAIGTFLWNGERRRGLIDFKTSKGVYFTEDTLQLAAYRYATALTTWRDKKVVDREPMPEVDFTAVLWLRPDGEYRFVEMNADEDALGHFMKLRELWTFQRELDAAKKAWEKDDAADKEAVAA
jgi:hypothetical protein